METLEALAARLATTKEIGSVVRTMKSLSAASVRPYERAMAAAQAYERTVELGLAAVLRRHPERLAPLEEDGAEGVIVFGSDRGLCGRFNERVADLLAHRFPADAPRPRLLAVGARMAARLEARGLAPERTLSLPGSAAGLVRLAQGVLVEADRWRAHGGVGRIHVVHNRRTGAGAAEPVSYRLLPLADALVERLTRAPWPSRRLPVWRAETEALLSWLVREHLMVGLHRAGAESLAAEHAARLAAMTGAERNIEERLETLSAAYRRTRQAAITSELMDIVGGVEAMRDRGQSVRPARSGVAKTRTRSDP